MLQFPGILCSVHFKVLHFQIVVFCALKTAAGFFVLSGIFCALCTSVARVFVPAKIARMLLGKMLACCTRIQNPVAMFKTNRQSRVSNRSFKSQGRQRFESRVFKSLQFSIWIARFRPSKLCSVHLNMLQFPGFLSALCTLKMQQCPGFLCSVYLDVLQFPGFLCSVHLEVLQFQGLWNGFFDPQAGMAVFFGRCCWGLRYGPFKEGSAGSGTANKHRLTWEKGEAGGRDRYRYR